MIRSKSSLRGKLIVTANAEITIRSFRQADRLQLGVIAGFDGVRGWIYHLAVSPAHRRRGIATRLMRGAEATLRALGCPKINLQVRATNQSVVRFYQTLGYQVEERLSMGRALD